MVFDGKLAQIGPNDTFHETKDGKFITVLGEEPDLSKCPPELRTKIRKAIADARARKGGGKVVTKYIVDGKEMDRASAQKSLREAGLELTISVDLDAFHYRAIGYGKDRDHLVLTPKRGGGGGRAGGSTRRRTCRATFSCQGRSAEATDDQLSLSAYRTKPSSCTRNVSRAPSTGFVSWTSTAASVWGW